MFSPGSPARNSTMEDSVRSWASAMAEEHENNGRQAIHTFTPERRKAGSPPRASMSALRRILESSAFQDTPEMAEKGIARTEVDLGEDGEDNESESSSQMDAAFERLREENEVLAGRLATVQSGKDVGLRAVEAEVGRWRDIAGEERRRAEVAEAKLRSVESELRAECDSLRVRCESYESEAKRLRFALESAVSRAERAEEECASARRATEAALGREREAWSMRGGGEFEGGGATGSKSRSTPATESIRAALVAAREEAARAVEKEEEARLRAEEVVGRLSRLEKEKERLKKKVAGLETEREERIEKIRELESELEKWKVQAEKREEGLGEGVKGWGDEEEEEEEGGGVWRERAEKAEDEAMRLRAELRQAVEGEAKDSSVLAALRRSDAAVEQLTQSLRRARDDVGTERKMREEETRRAETAIRNEIEAKETLERLRAELENTKLQADHSQKTLELEYQQRTQQSLDQLRQELLDSAAQERGQTDARIREIADKLRSEAREALDAMRRRMEAEATRADEAEEGERAEREMRRQAQASARRWERQVVDLARRVERLRSQGKLNNTNNTNNPTPKKQHQHPPGLAEAPQTIPSLDDLIPDTNPPPPSTPKRIVLHTIAPKSSPPLQESSPSSSPTKISTNNPIDLGDILPHAPIANSSSILETHEAPARIVPHGSGGHGVSWEVPVDGEVRSKPPKIPRRPPRASSRPGARTMQNLARIEVALKKVLLAGTHQEARRDEALEIAREAAKDDSQLLVVFKGEDGQAQRGGLLGLYALHDLKEHPERIWGRGPPTLEPTQIKAVFKFSTVDRTFQRLPTLRIVPTADAAAIIMS